MKYWFDTVETIGAGVGFSHYDGLHLAWLIGGAVFMLALSLVYRRQAPAERAALRKWMSNVIIADELFKMVMLAIGRRYLPTYLPLHLCSVNIFLIAIHARRPNVTLDSFLYTVGVPAAIAALLFPTWTELPLGNFMHIHSFSVHILLAAYPVMLLAGGDIVPRAKHIPRCIALLAALAALALAANLLLDTNFMFLMSADPGNPLYLFGQLWGDHRLGFAVLIPAVLLVMYGPLELVRAIRAQK